MTNQPVFRGAATALITPLTESGIDYAQFGRLVDWQIEEGINGLMISNAMHLSSWTGKTVTLPIDEDLFLEELNKRRATSRLKTGASVTLDTEGTY